MILELLICTNDKGIEKVEKVLLPPMRDIKYLVSWQCANASGASIPDALKRDDVKVLTCQGEGVSKNRNNAIANASGDICLIADEDCRYETAHLNKIIEIFEAHPAVDLATFKMKRNVDNKTYLSYSFDLRQAQEGYYVDAFEIAFRRLSIQGRIAFNELFGKGAPVLSSGEEEVFIYNALEKNLHCEYFPYVVVDHDQSVGNRGGEPSVLMARGAFLRLSHNDSTFPRALMMAKEVSANTGCGYFKALHYILKGVSYIKRNFK